MKSADVLLKLAALALAIAPLVVAAWGTYFLCQFYNSRSYEISAQRLALGKLRALASQLHELDNRIKTRSKELNEYFFTAPDDSTMSALLQRRLQAIVGTHQAELVRTAEIPQTEINGIIFTGVRLEISGHTDSLAKTVQMIESSTPPLFIDQAHLKRDVSIGNDAEDPVLDLSLDILVATLPSAEPVK
jgi:hypothetical protein